MSTVKKHVRDLEFMLFFPLLIEILFRKIKIGSFFIPSSENSVDKPVFCFRAANIHPFPIQTNPFPSTPCHFFNPSGRNPVALLHACFPIRARANLFSQRKLLCNSHTKMKRSSGASILQDLLNVVLLLHRSVRYK